ncbi:RNA polymerase sigma factor [uncultured Dokdonia sp.]|uniref:RNA polymerase sigma factor n=1 Tax=uncultured Dokdonia sp. TaxID=575653 RepID=UPI0026051795|nr:RNA polymerase sigma factor [uncultured Dokdonia sp.]
MKNNPTHKDYELIKKAIEGDISAFRQLVYLHKDVSLSLAVSIVKDIALAEDILQDVFIKVYHKLNSFTYKSAFTTWLYRIVVNTSYNELKKKKKHLSLDLPQESFLLPPTVDTSINEADQKKYIQLALQRLKPDESLVLRLFYLCELSIKEIEEITNFKISKIKVLLHRGRSSIHFELKQLLRDDLKHLL